MAKEDFCYTHYDGDEARDVSHMNRLERGCYGDIRMAQRKRGHLSINDIKKVLGKDFEECWPALEWVLKVDGYGNYFIEWLDTSIEKSRAHSKKQKTNVQKRWKNDTEPIPKHESGINVVIPLEDGDGNEYEDVIENKRKGGVGEKQMLVPQMQTVWTKHQPNYPSESAIDFPFLQSIAHFIAKQEGISYQANAPNVQSVVLAGWEAMSNWIASNSHYSKLNLQQIDKYKQAIILEIKNGKSNSKLTPKQITKSSGAERLAADLQAELGIESG